MFSIGAKFSNTFDPWLIEPIDLELEGIESLLCLQNYQEGQV
jgi:hypothetical protein